MHIPDAVLNPEVCLVTGAVSVGAVGYSVHRMRDVLADRTIPLTGMMSALIFSGQMVNFPIGLPVSGHLLGGVLAATILGPWAACVAMTLVLVVQWTLFADGGTLALGPNVLHMAVIGSMGGYAVYATLRRLLGGGVGATVAGAVIASWLSVMAAACLFCIEFWYSWRHSEQYQFGNIFTLMVSFHSLIGIGECVITGCVLSFVLKQRPDLVYSPNTEGSRPIQGLGRTVLAGLVVALAVSAFLAPFASAFPDGLEAVAERTGFDQLGETTPILLEDYEVPLFAERWQGVSVAVAGIGGTLIVFGVAMGLGRAVRGRRAGADGT